GDGAERLAHQPGRDRREPRRSARTVDRDGIGHPAPVPAGAGRPIGTGTKAVGQNRCVPQSVIGRVGQWCFSHRWLVLVAWLIAVGGGLFATGPLFSRLSDGGLPHSVESVA